MKNYQHLFNAAIGCCAVLIGLRMIIPMILEITGIVLIFTDGTISQPWEIFSHYLSLGMPVMPVSLFISGILCLIWFIKRKSGSFIQWAALPAFIGYLYPPVFVLISVGDLPLALIAGRYLIYPILLVLCGIAWKRYLKSEAGQTEQPKGRSFPFVHEFLIFSRLRNSTSPKDES